MFRMHANNSHSQWHRYTHLILALGIDRKPIVWGFIASPSHYNRHRLGYAPCGVSDALGRGAVVVLARLQHTRYHITSSALSRVWWGSFSWHPLRLGGT